MTCENHEGRSTGNGAKTLAFILAIGLIGYGIVIGPSLF
jgi:hypothetical protein